MKLEIETHKKRQVVDITGQIEQHVPDGSGLASIFIKHTTAALTTADLDPGTDEDLLDALTGMLPEVKWRHPHDPAHAPSHLLSSILGPQVTIPYNDGKLQQGTWQRLILVELDGPRSRQVELSIIRTADS